MYIIYKITCASTNKLYIGYTIKTTKERFHEHALTSKRTQLYQSKLYKAMRKYGESKFSINILAEVNEKSEALTLERQFIKDFDTIKSGYNISEGGHGGKTRSASQIETLRKRMTGINNPMYGIPLSEAKKHKQSQITKEWLRKESPEHKAERFRKSGESQKGRKKTPEQIEKIRQSKLGKPTGPRVGYILTDPKGNEYILVGKDALFRWCKETNHNIWVVERRLLHNISPVRGNLQGWKAKSYHMQLEGK